MTIKIRHPAGRLSERTYVLDLLFNRYLGFDIVAKPEQRHDVEISLRSDPERKKLILRDTFFSTAEKHWLHEASLPAKPTQWWAEKPDLKTSLAASWPLPVLYGEPLRGDSYFIPDGESIELGVDVIGSAFFMLSRYEELVSRARDEHDRFTAGSSVALREGFLNRPLVDEYIEILWACMTELWPRLKRKQHDYRFYLSCDVDHPSSNTHGSLLQATRSAIGDVVHGRGLKMAIRRLGVSLRNARGDYSSDPHNTFDFMMNTAEEHDLKVAFYFISGNSGGVIDGDYTLDIPWIRTLMRQMHERGHKIGLHPSYNTYLDPQQLQLEFSNLLRVAEREGIRQELWGGRQHYLRWRAPTTWRIWDDAGLDYDSTVGFADHVGFRCGTCREFPVFDLQGRKTLDLVERPLIVMEGTLLAAQYMNVSHAEALDWIERLSGICRRYRGNFTLLWHNSMLITPELKQLFKDALTISA